MNEETRALLKREAQKAIDVQNASNLSGVIISMNDARARILDAGGRGKGSEWLCGHPILRMYASKIHSLMCMGLSDTEVFGMAYELCQKMAQGDVDCY